MRNLLLFLFILICFGLQAQTGLFAKLRSVISLTHPEINIDDKILALNLWSIDDAGSREANKSFDKAYSVYEFAKLKGGTRGIVVVAVNKDNLSGMATITFGKDGIRKVISLGIESFSEIDFKSLSNIIFDSSGNEIHKNLNSAEIFSSVNQLITR